jgi:hypothetical protein
VGMNAMYTESATVAVEANGHSAANGHPAAAGPSADDGEPAATSYGPSQGGER